MYPYDNNPPQQPPNPPAQDPFQDWYRNTIQANPGRYDPAHFTEGQARAWFPLWDASSGGFRSSKVDMNGNPIQGNQFAHPDECPPGMQAFGQNQCRPVGAIPGQGSPGGFAPGGYTGPWGSGGGGLDFQWPDLPKFSGPGSITEDPGYKFRLKEGQDALEASAAAKGVLNTGGTLQNLVKFGQDYATNEFGNAWQRSKDLYAPLLAQWQMQSGAQRDKAFAQYQRQWDAYRFALDDEYRRQAMLLNAQPPGGF